MIKRTTIELDEERLERAKRALGCSTARATIEEALRRAADERAARQRAFLAELATHVDVDVLAAGEMWR